MRRYLCLLACLCLAVSAPWVVGAAKGAGRPPPAPAAPNEVVLRVALLTEFEGEGMTLMAWLRARTADWEAQTPGARVLLAETDRGKLRALAAAPGAGAPDVYLFPPGTLVRDLTQPLPSGAQALAIAWQPYVWLADAATPNSPEGLEQNQPTAQLGNDQLLAMFAQSTDKTAGLTLGRDGMGGAAAALCENGDFAACTGALGSALSPQTTRSAASALWKKGGSYALIGSGRDTARARQRAEQGQDFFGGTLLGYTDMVLWGAMGTMAPPEAAALLAFLQASDPNECGLTTGRQMGISTPPPFAAVDDLTQLNQTAIALLQGQRTPQDYARARAKVLGDGS